MIKNVLLHDIRVFQYCNVTAIHVGLFDKEENIGFSKRDKEQNIKNICS